VSGERTAADPELSENLIRIFSGSGVNGLVQLKLAKKGENVADTSLLQRIGASKRDGRR